MANRQTKALGHTTNYNIKKRTKSVSDRTVLSLWSWSLLYQDFPQKLSSVSVTPTDTIYTGENMSHTNGPFTHTEDITSFLQDFEDADLQRYTCFFQ